MSDDLGQHSPAIRLSAFGSLDGAELAGLASSTGVERHLERGETLWREGERLPGVYLLLEGWAASALTCGDRARHIAKVHLPGDMLGMPSLALSVAGETLVALTPATLRTLPLHSLGHLFAAHPRIAAMLFLVSQEERVELMDRVAAVARTDITTRVAAMMLRLHARIVRSFPATGDSFHLPLTQQDLADLSAVTLGQMGRALKQLRAMDVLGWSRQRVTIIDAEALRAHAKLPDRQLAHDPWWLPASG